MSDGYEEVVDPIDGTRWSVDARFLASNWTCIWDRGCEGILAKPTADLQQGCCSVGAQMIDEAEAMRVAALGMALDPQIFQHHDAATAGGVFTDESRSNTRVVDGACIFLNRPGFDGGTGCALHLAAIVDDEHPIEYKPTICWQAPFKVDIEPGQRRVLRPWTRDDWDSGADDMAWCCPEPTPSSGLASAHIGDTSVVDSLQAELSGLVGPEVAVELKRRFGRS